MKKRYSLLILLGLASAAFAQNAPKTISDPTGLAATFAQKHAEQRLLAEKIAQATGQALRRTLADGSVMEFAGFDANGQMLFNRNYNIGSGRTISTNKVWPGGSTNTSLTGAGMTGRLGEWDGGAVLTTHQELAGRVTQMDGTTTYIDHATHVAGTMIASGVSANAKGMAYAGSLYAYDWNNDESEMQSAGSSGMLVSNHSYGTICAWTSDAAGTGGEEWWGDPSISQVEDYKYGFYDQQAAEWDQIALSNPNYLICKAAGNDRGQSFSGQHFVRDASGNWVSSTMARNAVGPYDCIATNAVAKNILTVGAVNKIGSSNTNNGWTKASDVVMSSFSGWGPTDDGRIKPDVVAAGVSIYSSISTGNTNYDTYNGTSMATPAVTGSLLLVQQHHFNCKNKYMRAATLKALAIHTADEAGSATGPDYQFGWGLLNTAKAVQLITDSTYNQIQERSLANAITYTQTIVADGNKPLRVTIAWTDRVGTPVSAALDPTDKMLVNDLDIRLTRVSDNTVFYPYILNPASPASAATTGDNARDNVEQIHLETPQTGSYVLTVSHKGTLASGQAQPYSLIIGGVAGMPAASFTASARAICTGSSVTYTDISAGNPTLRKWYFPGGTPSTSTAATVTVTYAIAGKYPVALKVTNSLGNDSTYQFNYISAGGISLPFTETFESSSATASQWVVTNPNADSTWRLATVGGTTPGSTAYCLPFYNYSTTGRRDQLSSPPLSLKGYSSVTLSFQYAYAGYPGNATDSLIVLISTNCGGSYTRLAAYGENGSGSFRTAAANTNEFIPSASTEWKAPGQIAINLNAYASLSNVKVRFESYNAFGNNLYIDNVNITGVPLKPAANFFASKTTVCAGEPLNLYDSTQNAPTGWQWTFTGADLTSSNLQNPVVSYSATGNYAVKLVATNSTGADSITKTNYIHVIASPGMPSISNSRPLSFCSGDSTVLSSDSAAVQYAWYRNDVLVPGATAQSITVYDSASYRVKTINSNGCGTLSNAVSVSMRALPPVPVVTSNITTGTFCPGGTATLTSSAASGNQWYRNNVLLAGQTGKTYSTQDSGTYSVKIANGICVSTSLPKTLSLFPKPIDLTINGTITPHYGDTVTYSVVNTPGSTYIWNITGGVALSGATTNSIVIKWNYSQLGSVKVQETAATNCKGDAKIISITLQWRTGIEEAKGISNLQFFPNPAHSALNVSFISNESGRASVSIANLLGQSLISDSRSNIHGSYSHSFNLEGLAPGMYLLQVETGKGTHTEKIVIE